MKTILNVGIGEICEKFLTSAFPLEVLRFCKKSWLVGGTAFGISPLYLTFFSKNQKLKKFNKIALVSTYGDVKGGVGRASGNEN